MNSDAEFPELSKVTFLLQAPKQLHLGWGSTSVLSLTPSTHQLHDAANPLLATTLEIPLPTV